MARKSKSKSRLSSTVGRDVVNTIIANTYVLPRRSVRSQSQLLLDLARLNGQDNRAYNPTRISRPARTVSGRVSSLGVSKKASLSKVKLNFFSPDRVTLCVRRAQRKEVLHALGKSGRNGGRRYRRNFYSNVKC